MGFEESAISSLKRNARLRKGISKRYFKNKEKYIKQKTSDRTSIASNYSLDDHATFRFTNFKEVIVIGLLLVFAIGLLYLISSFWI